MIQRLTGLRLKTARISAGLNQLDLAEKIGKGVTERKVSNWETGRVAISHAEIMAAARAIGVPPETISPEFFVRPYND